MVKIQQMMGEATRYSRYFFSRHDVIASGNHIWDKPETAKFIDRV